MRSVAAGIAGSDVVAYARDHCFTAPGDDLIGAEVEWIVAPIGEPATHAHWSAVEAAARAVPLAGGCAITFEPGGQIEIVSPPAASAREACDATGESLVSLRRALGGVAHEMHGIGLDPLRAERRVLAAPRYAAMEAFFDMDNLAGRTMMTRTAAIQVNVGLGADPHARWRRAHAIGPVLAATFANSPFFCGAANGWKSNRLATWAAIDRTRTAPADDGGDPIASWASYVMRANVMLIRVDDNEYRPQVRRFTFEDWMRDGHPLGHPTADDLAYHCTTLFPPVRPRGWLELRMCDALPDPLWRAPVELIDAIMRDDDAGARALDACDDARGMWADAARDGLANPVLAGCARALFDLAPRSAVLDEYRARFVDRGRCPADDLLDAGAPVDALAEGRVPAWT